MHGGGAASPDAAICISPEAGPIVGVAPAGIRVENCYVFKSRLQEYAQRVGIPTPEYHTLKEGPSHEPVFKSTVFVNNTKYESLPGFFSRKAAEQSAAEVALMEIAMSAPVTEIRNMPAVQETGLCKNLLQEYAQKMNYAIPSYICTKQASGVAPFVCSVEIGGILYIGAAARTKKEAEIKAARTALLAIQSQSEGGANGAKKYIVVPGQRPDKETNKNPTETPIPLRVKKRGSRKKWNKRKFRRMADRIVDAGKDAEGLGTLLHDDYEEARRIGYELPTDTAMVQFNKEVVMTQPGEGDRIVQLEPPRDPAEVQHNKEARSVEQDPPRDPAEVQHNKEARTVEQDPPSNTEVWKPDNKATTTEQESVSAFIALRSNGDSTDVEAAPGDTLMMQGQESEATMQEASHAGEQAQPN
uniref:DRBM domain-containing protein n=1 Tax=Zea mays TaxID=4577 RepID=A0A804MKT3_MAIZE